MPQNSIDSVCEFLLHAGTDFRFYDLGRGVRSLSSQSFLRLENGEVPVPYPRQGQAWFAVVFWPAQHAKKLDPAHQYIWFLRLALDEQGKIVSATRNHFLRIIVEALQQGKQLDEGSKDNPYIFTPSETTRAQLSARAKHELNMVDTACVNRVKTYICAPGAADWRSLSTQDVYDASYKLLDDPKCVESLMGNWDKLATPFTEVLLAAMEPINLSFPLEAWLIEQIMQANESKKQGYLLKAIRCDEPKVSISAVLVFLLNEQTSLNVDTLSLIAARFGHLFSPGVLSMFFQRCATLDDELETQGKIAGGFFEDLVRIPSIRNHALSLLAKAH